MMKGETHFMSKKSRKTTNADYSAPKDKGSVLFNAIVAAVIVAVFGLGCYAVGAKYIPRYQEQRAQQKQQEEQSKTVSDVMKEKSLTLDEFKTEYGIPADTEVTEDQTAMSLTGSMTMEGYAKYEDMTLEELREKYGLSEDLAADTPWQEAVKSMPVGIAAQEMFGMDFETFKSQMPGADSITEDMTWGDANKIIEAAYAAQQAQQTDDSSAASDTESSPSPDAAADSGKDN